MPTQQSRPARRGISKSLRFQVLARDLFTCQYCRASDVRLQIDHRNPVANGGTNDIGNLVTACETCNGGKGSLVIERNGGLRPSAKSQAPAAEFWTGIDGDPIKADRQIVQIKTAGDALSPAEDAVYQSLLATSTQRGDGRYACIGFERIGKIVRVTDKSAKASVRRLIEKQFIEVSRPAVIETRTPTEYRVFSYSDVLRRLSERGIGHVAKVSTGVFYALRA